MQSGCQILRHTSGTRIGDEESPVCGLRFVGGVDAIDGECQSRGTGEVELVDRGVEDTPDRQDVGPLGHERGAGVTDRDVLSRRHVVANGQGRLIAGTVASVDHVGQAASTGHANQSAHLVLDDALRLLHVRDIDLGAGQLGLGLEGLEEHQQNDDRSGEGDDKLDQGVTLPARHAAPGPRSVRFV